MLYRDGPLKGVNRPPSGTTMILGASASPGKWLERPASRLGVVLLHADGLCFLGRGVAPELLRRVCANRLEVPVSEEFLLEQLTRLTPEALTEALKVVDGFDGGVAVSSLAVEPEKSGTPTELLRLNVRTTKLEIPIGAVDFEALRTLFPWTQDQSRQVP